MSELNFIPSELPASIPPRDRQISDDVKHTRSLISQALKILNKGVSKDDGHSYLVPAKDLAETSELLQKFVDLLQPKRESLTEGSVLARVTISIQEESEGWEHPPYQILEVEDSTVLNHTLSERSMSWIEGDEDVLDSLGYSVKAAIEQAIDARHPLEG